MGSKLVPYFFAHELWQLHDQDQASGVLSNFGCQQWPLAQGQAKCYFEKSASHHEFHEGQFVLLNKFNFLNKNIKLAPKFSGHFMIICVKGPHNIVLLLTNDHKMIVHAARVKQCFGAEPLPFDTQPLIIISLYLRLTRPPQVIYTHGH